MDLKVYLLTLRLKGYLAYEYNPLHNYLTDVDLYEVETDVGPTLVPKGYAVNIKNGNILSRKMFGEESKWVDEEGLIISNENVLEPLSENLFASAGSLIDLDTKNLNFDLEHPVEIEVQPSYDGSVNLILNDDKNIPRLINSRFSVREKNTYEIVDRIGENDTNIYNSKTFDKDTSLYFLYEYNPTISFVDFVKGNLPVGLYCYYFTYCDADENESDFIAETGLIPVFIGNDGDPSSMDGGIKNQNTDKGIRLRLKNLDKSYNYLKVYQFRYFADYELNRVNELKKIYLKYPINTDTLYLLITGYEQGELLSPDLLNIEKFNPKSVLTLAQCKNILFFGNIVKNSDNYRELIDCSLRIIPRIKSLNIDIVDNEYNSSDGNWGYYSSSNMYDNVGYFNKEYYRFGVVYIYQNGTLSNVYNTLGLRLNSSAETNYIGELYETTGAILKRLYISIDDRGWIKNSEEFFDGNGSYLNARGVCMFDEESINYNQILGILFNIPDDVITHLKEDLGIRGLFFVRLKCIPNILAQCYLLPMDEILEGPVIEITGDGDKKYITECFLSQGEEKIVTEATWFLPEPLKEIKNDRLVVNDYESRLYTYKNGGDSSISSTAYAAICPDFLLNQPFYNLIFNGAEFKLVLVTEGNGLEKDGRFYREIGEAALKEGNSSRVNICSVTDATQTVAIKNKIFKLEQGKGEESFRFSYAGADNSTQNLGDGNSDEVNSATNLVRGMYSPYLAVYSNSKLLTGVTYNIYKSSSANMNLEYLNRMDSYEPFFAISDRYNFSNLEGGTSMTCWRGDCYLNTFTYRLNRNFNDPSLPNNDKIIDKNTWKDHYNVDNQEDWADISRSDLNAVQMGSWITFKVRSAMNYALRSIDHSFVAEEALMGSPRSFYPRSRLTFRGENKMPDSYLYNDAYRASLGYKCYWALQDINYIKDTFSNRILYSAISILDSFKNNYRDSLSTYFRDYSQEYGSILRLIEVNGNLLVVFEHAIGIAAINERVLAGEGDGGAVFINTLNVLPEELLIITNTYGTQWPESVIKSEAGFVYGVDTIAKKIWRVNQLGIELISDFKVNKFLIDNISLGERELTPIIGLRNVKSHFNNNKKDVMFTFYDDVYKDEEKVWNLCYNELMGEFTTFYSWIPSYSENIDTKFFTFNRNTSKWLTLLNKCNYNVKSNTGILLDIPVLKEIQDDGVTYYVSNIYYRDPNAIGYYTLINDDGTTSEREFKPDKLESDDLQNGLIEVEYKLEKDHWGYWKYVKSIENNKITFYESIKTIFTKVPVITLYLTPYIDTGVDLDLTSKIVNFKTETVAFTMPDIVLNLLINPEDYLKANLSTDFYLHGQAGIFNITEDTYPCHWYGEYHPFEFEIVVNDNIGLLKIFENLVIISNKAEPESFHFEVEGDNYEFSQDKRTMYFRQEATKNLFQSLGSDILYNRKFTDVVANKNTYEQYYRTLLDSKLIYENESDRTTYDYTKFDRVYPKYSHGLIQQVKSTIFPLYYKRVDTFNEIYHIYHEMKGTGYDFENLSGSEIVWNRDLNQFNVVTHIKNSPIDYVGRLRGNSRYKEGRWEILIPSIIFNLKNEESWTSWGALNKGDYFKLCDSALCSNARLGENNYSEIAKLTDLKGKTIPLPPIIINTDRLPDDFPKYLNRLPNTYINGNYTGQIKVDNWPFRKEARIRDKFIKIRVRYSGKNLAIIHSLITLYNISYS